MKKKVIIVFVFCCIIFTGCSRPDKKEPVTKNIVLFVEQNSESWLKGDATYEALPSDRIDALNERLKELKTNLKLTIKAYPTCMKRSDCSIVANNIIRQDKEADIVNFNEYYVSDLEPLSTYLNTEDGKKVMSFFSKNRLDSLKINKETYFIPKMIYPLSTPVIYLNKEYYQQHKNEIDDAKKTGTDLLIYFRDHYESKENWLLYSGIEMMPFLSDKYQEIQGTPLLIRKKDQKIVNPYEEDDVKEVMRLLAEIRWKGYTGKGLQNAKLQEIKNSDNFILSSSYSVSDKFPRAESNVVALDIGNDFYAYESGFSLLKDSNDKKDAFRLLSIINTDKKCSEILQFGVNPKRNSEGVIVSDDHTIGGSWNSLGNNFIIESAEQEVKDKLQTFKKMEETSEAQKQVLLPAVFDMAGMGTKVDELEQIMLSGKFTDTSTTACMACNVTEEVQNPDIFMREIEAIQKSLKGAGIDEVIKQLQTQLDTWKKSN